MSSASYEELIIEEVRKRHFLYQKGNSDFLNNKLKNDAWQEITASVARQKNNNALTGIKF